MAKQGGESLIIEIVWHDNLWQGPCKRPLENEACLPESGFRIWHEADYPDREAIREAKLRECSEPSERGHCSESVLFSKWEWPRWKGSAPGEGRHPRFIFFVSKPDSSSDDAHRYFRGFYSVSEIQESEQDNCRVVRGDSTCSSWFHPTTRWSFEKAREQFPELMEKDPRRLGRTGVYIDESLPANTESIASKILKHELELHKRALGEVTEEHTKKEIERVISKIRATLDSSPHIADSPSLINRYFISQGLHFTSHQLATFYTALKTKGFVILTGISGTGKTKLAQYFAELLGSKDQFHFAAVRPDWRDSKSLLGYFNPLLGQEGQFQSTDFLQFLLQAYDNYRSSLHKLEWEADDPYAGTLLAEPNAFGTDTARLDLKAVHASGQVVAEGTFEFKINEKRQLALPGRMSELGPFRNAAKIYALELDRVSPYFILFDEMNLAKVEYYFADFLSVLESGRDDDGFTKEALRFQYPEGIDGPPAKLCLPPNLYFIGTVNVDETTYMFSPKVLDRAFTLELGTVNLQDYPGEQGEPLSDEVLEQLRAHLLPDFTRQGQFAVVDKVRVSEFAATHDIYRQQLSTLNVLLRSHDLHFGYRVFDEIMMFLANAEGSPVFDGFGPEGLNAAFDAAVLMKVLPKFHGTRGKLREPLDKMVWWAREPDNPEAGRQALSDKLQNTEGIASLKEGLRKRIEGGTTEESSDANAFAYPRTALKALRMLHDLHTTGFASFA